jgi:peptidyl-prolyl cis-trans isomerase SurA
MMNKALLVIIFSLTFCSIKAQQIVDKIVAVVDDKIILYSDIESQYAQYIQDGEKPTPELRCDIIEQLITQKMLVAQALIDSVVVSDDEVEGELNRRVKYFAQMAGGEENLEKYYGKSIIQIKEEFREDIKQQLLSQRMQQNIIDNVRITPSDVRLFINKIPKDSLPYYNAEVEIGEIVIYVKTSEGSKQYSKQKIEDLRQRAIKGENFAALAELYSEDPGSATQGGELGFTNRGDLDPTFESAAYSLKKPGDISTVIESRFGFHVIQLIERRGERINVRHILIVPKTTSYDLAKARNLTDSLYDILSKNPAMFTELAMAHNEDENSKQTGGIKVNPNTSNTYFELSQLGQFDQQLALVVQGMSPGAIAEPYSYKTQTGKSAYRIVYLKSKTKPHQANLKDDYDKLQAITLQSKQAKVFDEWLQSRVNKTYVKINAPYADCDNLIKWNKPND